MDQTKQYITQQQIKIAEAYIATKFVLLTQGQYRRNFGRNKAPDNRTIEHLMAKYRETGSVANASRGHSSRPRSVKTPNNIQNLGERLEEFPRKSILSLTRSCTDRYIVLMLTKFIHALRRKRGVDMNTVNYQQDGAPPHCSNRFWSLLKTKINKSNKQYNEPVVKSKQTNTFFRFYYIRRIILRTRPAPLPPPPPPPNQKFIATTLDQLYL